MDFGFQLDQSYARLPALFFSRVDPTPVKSPEWVLFNTELAIELGLKPANLQTEIGLSYFAGNRLPDGSFPIAQAYAGHQFGYFTRLGDGRAILWGEQRTPHGRRRDIQLKGCGRTPYSRQGDGRAALGPMLREYIVSEAMHGLGIPTTRSLAVVATGEPVYRETALPGAILARVADSHLRVGTFQYAAKWGTVDQLRNLADYAIDRHYPELGEKKDRYLLLLQEVLRHQADLVARWQLVGFVHGVMNTDNMTISGETIDYGPCAFIDVYDPRTVFSSIDTYGRYAFGNQPVVAAWNLARFAEAILPLLHENRQQAIDLAQTVLSGFSARYQQYWLAGMRAKLGLADESPEDEILVSELLDWMKKYKADYTFTFFALTYGQELQPALQASGEFSDWRQRWQRRREKQNDGATESLERMKKVNPVIVARNHRVEAVLEIVKETGDLLLLNRFLAALANPFEFSSLQQEFVPLPPPSSEPYRTFCGT